MSKNFRESGTLLDSSVPPQTVLILLDVVPPTRRFRPVVNYHYGESWRRSGNTHPRALSCPIHRSADNALGVLPERVKASLRSRAIVSQERISV